MSQITRGLKAIARERAPKQMAYDSEDKYQTAVDKWQRDMQQVHSPAELLLEKQLHVPTAKINLVHADPRG